MDKRLKQIEIPKDRLEFAKSRVSQLLSVLHLCDGSVGDLLAMAYLQGIDDAVWIGVKKGWIDEERLTR